jgi:DNA-binding transcriptional LysR family regulator
MLPLAEAAEARHVAFIDAVAARGRAVAGTVRLTTTELLATTVVTPLVSSLRVSQPGLKIELVAEDRQLDLMRAEVDVAIRLGDPPDEPSLIRRHIGDSVWALFAARSYVEMHGLPRTPEELAGHAIIGGSGSLANLSTLRWLASLAPQAEVAMRCNSVPNLIAAVRSGVGIGPLPRLALADDPTVVRCLGPGFEKSAKIWLVYHESQRHTPHIRAFVDTVIQHFLSMRDALEGRVAQ